MSEALLEKFLESKANEISPLDSRYPDNRMFHCHTNDDALTDKWLENNTSYIWRVGVLLQWDSNKSDWFHVYIGHERRPGHLEYIGHLYYQGGENDDPGRCLVRVLRLASNIHPSFDDD